MGKYTVITQKELPKKNQTHEIWKNLGCLMMLIVPVISIAAANETVKWIVANNWKILPYKWLGTPRPPAFFYKSAGLMELFSYVSGFDNLYAVAVVSIFYLILISGLISMVYAIVYSMVGPQRYSPLDAPPEKIKARKKAR